MHIQRQDEMFIVIQLNFLIHQQKSFVEKLVCGIFQSDIDIYYSIIANRNQFKEFVQTIGLKW